jgi:pimeloyl-ACP methyl ester carboxylesterase
LRPALAGQALFIAGIVVSVSGCDSSSAPTHVARDQSLRSLYLYDAADASYPARALVFFLGNDIGFWNPHRQLAASLAKAQFDIAGLDIRPLMASLPEGAPQRDSAFADSIRSLIQRTRAELHADSIPLIIGGHSLGAELAIWTAAHVSLAGTVGVLALSPGSRSHLRVSVSDIMNGPEPTGPESFAVADAVAQVPVGERIVIVRGTRDHYSRVDSRLLARGGARIKRFLVPFAGHSLKRIATAGFETRRALEWLTTGR